jgi:DNA-binding NarL/FixJ family response regulator
MLRVLVADDHELVRRGIRQLVNSHPGWEVCGEACDGEEALKKALEVHPDILVLDLSMPIMNGMAVTRQLHQDAPGIAVLLYTFHDEEETVSAGLAAGARGYLLKSESGQNLESAIAALAAHKPYFSSCVSEFLLHAAVSDHRHSPLESFTVRELEIGQLIAEGYSNKLIARRVNRSIKTVESHRAAAMRKAGVRSAAAFVRFAIKNNLIQA